MLWLFCVSAVFISTDRYVIYGNHRDSWVHGAIDPSSGTSVMLEITRVLGKMVKQGEEELEWMTVCIEFSIKADLCGSLF